MARSTINSYQKTSSIVDTNFDFDALSQSQIDAWSPSAGLTLTKITYAQFKAETGHTGAHPLSNLGKDAILKVEVGTSAGGALFLCADEAMAVDFTISDGVTGMYQWVNETEHAKLYSTGAPGLKLWCIDGAVGTAYRSFAAPVTSVSTSGEWNLVGGIDHDDYDSATAGTPTLIDLIRMNIDTNSGEPTLYLTSFFHSAKRRPVIMIEQDDINDDTTEFFADLDEAGLKGAINGYSGAVDLAGHPTTAQIKTYLDSGHAVYTHGLGEYTSLTFEQSKAQVNTELDFWRAFYPEVLDDAMLMHHAYPGGKQTTEMREWMISQGFKTGRRTGTTPYMGLISQPEWSNTQYMHLPGWGTTNESSAVLTAGVDKAIESGTDLLVFVHQYITDHASRTAFKALLAHIKLRVDQGLCECMPRHLWYEKSIAQYGTRSAV